MKNSQFLFAIGVAVMVALLAAGFAEAQSGSSPEQQIIDIQVKGNYAVSSTSILNKLKIKPGDPFKGNAVNKELKRLYAMGYFNDVSVESEEHPEGVVVIFTVVEKPVVGEVLFEGNVHLKDGRLLKKIETKEGDLLDYTMLRKDVMAIKAYYTDEGYFHVDVDFSIDTDPVTEKTTITFLVDEGLVLKVKKVIVEGNMHIPQNDILKMMAIKPAWWFFRKGAFDEAKFRDDLGRISAYYRSKGFLDVQVSSREEYPDEGRDMTLIVVIDEGKKYMVGEVDVEGQLTVPVEDIEMMILTRPGDPFDYEIMQEDLENIRKYYYDRGYMDAEVDLRHKYNAASGNMDLFFIINSREIIKVGRINVIGNTKTKDKVIRREVRVYPGEQYDGEKLRKTKEKIYNLGFFEDVFLETVPTSDPDVKDLNVTVKETKTGEFSFGGGYSSVDAFIGFVQVSQHNFDFMDFPTFTGAGQSLTIRAEMGSARTNYFLGWTDPWIFDYPLLFGFDVYREEHNKYGLSGYGYDEKRTGGDLRLGKDLTDDLSTGLVYNLEEVQISDVPDNSTDALKKEIGKNLISSLTWSMTLDKRDTPPFKTRQLYINNILKSTI